MEIRITPIPEGSHEICIWTGGHHFGDDIDTVAVLHHLGDGVAEVALAHGHLNNEINIVIGMQAHQMGYRKLRFRVLSGHRATRWAYRIGSEDGCDLYEVELDQAIARALPERAL